MTKESCPSCQHHIDWKSEPRPKGNSQKKGNSGPFLMDRDECQMLDNDNNHTCADAMSGGVSRGFFPIMLSLFQIP